MKKKIIGTILLFLILSTITFKMPISEAANYYPSNSEIDNAINSIKSEYPSGSKFTGSFDGGIECIGFAKYAFNRIWGVDCRDAYTSDAKYKFQLSNTSVVDEVGSLTGSSVTTDNIRNLFYNTPKGSLVQMCSNGQQHTMLFVSCDSSNIQVLEANVDFNLTVSHSTISYSSLASRCAGSGNGISTYKYNGKKNSAATVQNYGTYCYIKTNLNGKYLTANGTDVVMKSKDNSYDQVWKIERNTDTNSADYLSMKITSVSTGKVLTMANSTANKADIYLASYTGGGNQKWYMNYMLPSDVQTYMLSTQVARTVMDISDANTAENATVAMYEDNRSKAQQFQLVTMTGSALIEAEAEDFGESFVGIIQNYDNSTFLTNKNTYVNFEANSNSAVQLWKFTQQSDGSYRIQSLSDNRYLSIADDVAGSKITLSSTPVNWKINRYSSTLNDLSGFPYKTGYRLIYTQKPLVLEGNNSSNATLDTFYYHSKCMIQVYKENMTSLKFYSGNDWIGVGETKDMSSEIYSSPSTRYLKKYVNWSVSNTSIATVDASGKVTGKKTGTFTLKATSKYDSSIVGTLEMHVGTELESISLNKQDVLLNVGETLQLNVSYNPSNATVSDEIKWTGTRNNVALADSNGLVTANEPGVTTITARVGDLRAQCIVRVKAENPSPVKFSVYTNSSSQNLVAGDSVRVYFRINTQSSNIYSGKFKIGFDNTIFTLDDVASEYYYDELFNADSVDIVKGTNYVEFNYNGQNSDKYIVTNSTNETVFYIDLDVKTTVNKYGSTPITLTAQNVRQMGGMYASTSTTSCSVNINQKTQSIKLNKTSLTMSAGYKNETLTAIVTPNTASPKLTWSSSDTSIVSVDSNGKLTSKNKAGTATITVKTTDGTKLSATCVVTVKKMVTSIFVSPNNIHLYEKGATKQLSANVYPSDAENTKLTWSSSNTNVATVNQNGLVTAVGNGECRIYATATDGSGVSDYINLDVTFPTGLKFMEESDTLEVGETGGIAVTSTPDGTAVPEIKFTCSNTDILEIYGASYNSIRYRAKKAGTATITATAVDNSSLKATFKVTVTAPDPVDIPLTKITLNKTTLSLTKGGTSTLTVAYTPSNTTDSKTVTWITSNSSVATVPGGKVTAVGAGTATITAKVGSKTATCKVTVTNPTIPLTKITLNKTTLSLTKGGTSTLTVAYTPSNTTDNKTVTWTTSNPSVVTVSGGKVTAVGAGTATITAKVGSKTATCKVTVTEPTTKTVGVKYYSHIQDKGWENDYQYKNGQTSGIAGQGLKVEAIKIMLENAPSNAKILYKSHVQDIGWESWKSNGVQSGTTGQNKKVEAIRIKLENMPGYSVMYRAYVEGKGWQGWVCDGIEAGTTGKNLKLEAIQIKIVKTSEAPTITPGVQYYSHIQDKGWEDRYSKVNGNTSGLEGVGLKVEAIMLQLTGVQEGASIEYKSHVQDLGWEAWKKDGETSGTTGQNKKIEAIRIRIKNMPGYSVMYRAYVEGQGWQDWVSDGVQAGTTGKNLKLEAIQVKIVKSSEAPEMNPGVQYYSHIQDRGWEGRYSKSNGATSGLINQGLKVEAIMLQLTGAPEEASIEYQAHVQDIGWEKWVKDGEQAGTTGQNKKVEALKIKLTNMPGYSVMYRAYVEGEGWQDWVKNGETAGTTGKNLRLEAIQIKIVKNS